METSPMYRFSIVIFILFILICLMFGVTRTPFYEKVNFKKSTLNKKVEKECKSEIAHEKSKTATRSLESKQIEALYSHLNIPAPSFWKAKIDTYKSVFRVYMEVTQYDTIIYEKILQYNIYKDKRIKTKE